MGDDQADLAFGFRFLHQADEVDGVLDALAVDDAGRLQDEHLVLRDPDLGAQVGAVGTLDGRVFELEDVGDEGAVEAAAAREVAAAGAVDDDVGILAADDGGEGHLEVLWHGGV